MMSEAKKEDDRFTALHWACYRGDSAEVKKILGSSGSQLDAALANQDNETEATPLMWACINGRVSVVVLLLNAGAELDVKDAFGQTALSHAVQVSKCLNSSVCW